MTDSATGLPMQARYVAFAIYQQPPVPFGNSLTVTGSTDTNGNGRYCYRAPTVGTWQIQLVGVTFDQGADSDPKSNLVTQDWINVPPPPPPPRPKVQLDTAVTPEGTSIVVGDTVTIHYAIVNNGQLEPAQYFLNPRIDGPAVFVSATPSQGSCSTQGDGLLCNFLRFQPGTRLSLDAVVRANGPGTIKLESVWVAGPGASPLWEYFFSSGGEATLSAIPRASDLAVRISTARRHVAAGKSLTALISVVNNGPNAAPDPIVAVKLHGLIVESAYVLGGRCSGRLLRCRLASLASGSTAGLLITLRAPAAGAKTITAGISSLTAGDPSTVNNSVTVTVAVTRAKRPK